jgi:hypothetical protein
MNIWTRIKLWAERKEQEAWLDKYGCDQRCPKCDTWQANCGGWQHVERNTPNDIHDVCTCGKCGQKTTFLDFGMGFLAVDPVTLERI